MWTSGKNQIRLGYGDFSSSTGINDSAYTPATRQTFYWAPTAEEFIGIDYDTKDREMGEVIVPGAPDAISFLQQLKKATTPEEKMAIIKRMHDIAEQAYNGAAIEDEWSGSYSVIGPTYHIFIEIKKQEKRKQAYFMVGRLQIICKIQILR